MDTFNYKKADGFTALSASISDFQYTTHSHEEYAVGVTLRGVQQFHMNGNLQSSGPGGSMLFYPGQVHDGMAWEKTGIDYVMFYIEPSLFSEITGRKEPLRFPSPVLYNRSLFGSIHTLANAVFGRSEDALYSELLLSLAEHFALPSKAGSFGHSNAYVSRAKEVMVYNLDSEKTLRLDDVCREINVPKYTFIRMFKANTGMSPYQFYLNCKVEKAKRIIETDRDIYQAVADCGFVDLSHLNRNFKGHYGVTAFDYLSSIE